MIGAVVVFVVGGEVAALVYQLVDTRPHSPGDMRFDLVFVGLNGGLVGVAVGVVLGAWLGVWIDSRPVPRIGEIFAECAAIGATYGAALGAVWGAVCAFLAPEFDMEVWIGALGGAFFGALGGCVAGFAGSVSGGRVGWVFAWALGGALASLPAWGAFPVEAVRWKLLWLPLGVSGVLAGGVLGIAVRHGLRVGRTAVPGVGALVAIIHDDNPPAAHVTPHDAAAEVSPAASPEGRGDETTPASPI
jgi:hypothetical protein